MSDETVSPELLAIAVILDQGLPKEVKPPLEVRFIFKVANSSGFGQLRSVAKNVFEVIVPNTDFVEWCRKTGNPAKLARLYWPKGWKEMGCEFSMPVKGEPPPDNTLTIRISTERTPEPAT